jgi:hypothetical protein
MRLAHLAHDRSLCWHPGLSFGTAKGARPESASRGTCHPGGIIPEWWATSSRIGGRHHSGIMGDLLPNRQLCGGAEPEGKPSRSGKSLHAQRVATQAVAGAGTTITAESQAHRHGLWNACDLRTAGGLPSNLRSFCRPISVKRSADKADVSGIGIAARTNQTGNRCHCLAGAVRVVLFGRLALMGPSCRSGRTHRSARLRNPHIDAGTVHAPEIWTRDISRLAHLSVPKIS